MAWISTHINGIGIGSRRLLLALAAALTLPLGAVPASAAPPPHATAWTGAWATSPQREAGPTFADQTLRMLVHPTLGGSPLRIRLSNAYGAEDVTFGAVGVARAAAAGSPELIAGTGRRVTFQGRRSVTVPAG